MAGDTADVEGPGRFAAADEVAGGRATAKHLPALVGHGPGPQIAESEWAAMAIGSVLKDFDPVDVSSLASAMHTDDSDLDILCDLRAPAFLRRVTAAYGTRLDFAHWTTGARTVVTFAGQHVRVELVGEARPTYEQTAFRHAVAHRRLAALGGPAFTAHVRAVRRDRGLKTEAALAAALGLHGDAHDRIAELADVPDDRLLSLLANGERLASWQRATPPRAPTSTDR